MTEQEQLRIQFAGTISPSSGARKYSARFVRAGEILRPDRKPAGIKIEADAIRKAAESKLFENRAVFVDHAGVFENSSLTRLAGVTQDTFYNPIEQTAEGRIVLNDTPSGELARQIIDDLLNEPGQAPDVGLSMVFYPKWNADRDTIIEIRHVESVDLVFQPAADGRILQHLSSHFVGASAAQPINVGASVARPINVGASVARPINQEKENQPMPETPVTENVAAPQEQPNAVAAWQDAIAETAADSIIAASGLPEASRQRLAGARYAHPQGLRAAIEAERAYLAALSQDNVIQIGGVPPRSPQITGMLTSVEKIQLALDALLAGSRPPAGIQPLTGIRELYHLLSGDYEMSGVFHGDRISFANVNSSTMASMVANALNKVVMAEFQAYPQWWTPITIMTDFDSMHATKWIVLGGVGELPTVAEGAAYTELTWDDKYETASFVKKGGYLGITLEAIDKDDTGRLRNAPRALAQAAWLTLSKSVSAIFTASSGVGPTLVDSTALFDASRGNLGTTALSITSYIAARTAMRKFTELNSGERLGALTAPKFLLVPPDLEITALQVLASEYDYTYALSNGVAAPVNVLTEGNELTTRMAFARDRVIVVDLWTDTNDWAAVADPRLYPTIGIGFRYGRTPEIFSVASPTAGLMFTNDTMPVKVRFVYATGPIDWRGLYKANVT